MASTNPQTQAPRRSRESDKVGVSFKKQEEIGKGSFATVYKALHTDPTGVETLVAIKSVNMGKLNKKLKDNLTSEINILKSLHHPHIAALIDCKETTQHIHLIMEYVALGDLSQFIKRRDQIKDSIYVGNMMTKYPNPRAGGLHEVVVRHFLQQLASALQFLRVRNLIHRDVKPQNLLLNPSPEYFTKVKPSPMPHLTSADALEPVCGIRSLPMLKIADFGFARSLPSTSLAETLCGSPLYMAPEILRYEKYDAKADLWSVGTVLYEMVTSRPPFRAANHVELLRKIEKTNDVIKFAEDIVVSDALKKLIRSLLKRDPRERVSFPDLFDNEIITGPIPGLAEEDLPVQAMLEEAIETPRNSSRTDPIELTRPGKIQELESPYQASSAALASTTPRRSSIAGHRRLSSLTDANAISKPLQPQPISSYPREGADKSPSPQATRPALLPRQTAPERTQLGHAYSTPVSAAMTRQSSGGQLRHPSNLREQIPQLKPSLEAEQTAQDIAFERDYVLVEKRAVEVNALADELEATPLHRPAYGSAPATTGALVRRATHQGQMTPSTGAQTTASRAVSIASGKRPDVGHQRTSSYEQQPKLSSTASAASAISRAISLASGRLGFSPPINFVKGGRSPPIGYGAFPMYPSTQSSLVLIGDTKQPPLDEDTKYVQQVEELATRSDVVFGFAEVKYKQLTPAVPSPSQIGLGLRDRPADGADDSVNDDLTVEALVTVSEEALVLYVKALTLLQKAMDTAGRWWNRKKKDGDNSALISIRGGHSFLTISQRMNNVVQWTRNRFNEVLEKTDLVRLRLIDSQKRLPEDHPSHPNNLHAIGSSAGLGTSADQVIVTTGVTAEKLMYDRALEMSRSAAISELTGEDLVGCEISYVTAIRMLEAVLEGDDDPSNKSGTSGGKSETSTDDAVIAGLEAEDRDSVLQMVKHIRGRLEALRKKLHIIQKRASAPTVSSPRQASPPISQRPGNTVSQR